MRARLWVTALTAALLVGGLHSAATASPQLLAEIPASVHSAWGCWGTPGCPNRATGTAGVVFVLTADMVYWPGDTFGGSKLFNLNALFALGDASQPFAPGTAGALIFNASNSPDFSGFAGFLTGSTSLLNLDTTNVLLLEGTTIGGDPYTHNWNYELYIAPYERPEILAGATIDYIKLVVDSVVVDLNPQGIFSGSNFSLDYSTQAAWEVWGSPKGSAIPEPGTLALLGLGLAGLAATRRRKQ